MGRAPNRAMLHAVGFSNEDFKKPQIGVASTWSMVTPCNMHINKLADAAAVGVNNADGKAVIFNTITISDGISMGTKGMKYLLVSCIDNKDSINPSWNHNNHSSAGLGIHPLTSTPIATKPSSFHSVAKRCWLMISIITFTISPC